MFGDSEYLPHLAYSSIPIEEQFEALSRAKDAGKICEFGVSNETPWGFMRFCETGTFSGVFRAAALYLQGCPCVPDLDTFRL